MQGTSNRQGDAKHGQSPKGYLSIQVGVMQRRLAWALFGMTCYTWASWAHKSLGFGRVLLNVQQTDQN
eukprot:1158359-Pelagomonas_calceolata.AAC.11